MSPVCATLALLHLAQIVTSINQGLAGRDALEQKLFADSTSTPADASLTVQYLNAAGIAVRAWGAPVPKSGLGGLSQRFGLQHFSLQMRNASSGETTPKPFRDTFGRML